MNTKNVKYACFDREGRQVSPLCDTEAEANSRLPDLLPVDDLAALAQKPQVEVRPVLIDHQTEETNHG